MLDRRQFGQGLLALATSPVLLRVVPPAAAALSVAALPAAEVAGGAAPAAASPAADRVFMPWSPGVLDIHHIDTGRGNATFILAPDGTTILIDCGASDDGPEVSAPARPDGSRRPGEWVAAYAMRHARAAGRDKLDYLIVTHIHPDHVSGVGDLDRLMQAKVVIDRSYPDYGLLPPPPAPFTSNYLAWLDERRRSGREVVKFDVGSSDQVKLRAASRYPTFAIRALAGNGRIWNGAGADARAHAGANTVADTASHPLFPDLAGLAVENRPTENLLSLALRLSYGRFSYFTGGDLISDTRDGRFPWMDVETPVARVAGRVEVAVANHHGYFDACGPDFVRLLDAQAYVIPSWHLSHPGQAQLQRLLGAWPGVKPHDVFATELLPGNRQLNERFASQLKSTQGHVVVRVAPGGDSYQVFVLDSSRKSGEVRLQCGPYLCRS